MRMTVRWLRACGAVLVMAFMVLAPPSSAGMAAAQATDGAPAGVVEEMGGAAPVSDPLPAPDFSMAYRHVFLAFAFAWILMLAYGVWIQRGMGEMEREIERLGG